MIKGNSVDTNYIPNAPRSVIGAISERYLYNTMMGCET